VVFAELRGITGCNGNTNTTGLQMKLSEVRERFIQGLCDGSKMEMMY